MKPRTVAIVLVFAFIAAACGGIGGNDDGPGVLQGTTTPQPTLATGGVITDDGSAETTPMATAPDGTDGSATTSAAATHIASDLPMVNVVNLADGSELALNTLATGESPLLLWFWAPH